MATAQISLAELARARALAPDSLTQATIHAQAAGFAIRAVEALPMGDQRAAQLRQEGLDQAQAALALNSTSQESVTVRLIQLKLLLHKLAALSPTHRNALRSRHSVDNCTRKRSVSHSKPVWPPNSASSFVSRIACRNGVGRVTLRAAHLHPAGEFAARQKRGLAPVGHLPTVHHLRGEKRRLAIPGQSHEQRLGRRGLAT